MSDTASSQFETDYSTAANTVEEVESSLRLPVLHTITAAAVWMVIGTLLAFIASLQLHSPGVFADCSYLNHGKTKTAAWNALLYGFALQMAIGVMLYVVCRLSRKALRHSFTVFVANKFWNLGVLLGVVGIFIGDSTGHEFFAIPFYSAIVLFLSFAVILLKTFLALHYRTEREFYVSQLYLGAAGLWFLWALSTAIVVLQLEPVRGVVQLVVSEWYVNNVFQIVLGGAGVGAILYFVPQLASRPLHSKELALTGFWLLVFVGGWAGITGKLPLPAWVAGVSSAAGFLLIVPLIVVLYNVYSTVAPDLPMVTNRPAGKSLLVGLAAYSVWTLLEICSGFIGFGNLVQFTHFATAQNYLFLYGFVGMSLIGAACVILPRLTGQECGGNGQGMVFLALLGGVVLTFGGNALAGLRQGFALKDGGRAFQASVDAAQGMLALGTFGTLVLLAAAGLFLFGCLTLIGRALYAEYPFLEWFRDDSDVASEGGAE